MIDRCPDSKGWLVDGAKLPECSVHLSDEDWVLPKKYNHSLLRDIFDGNRTHKGNIVSRRFTRRSRLEQRPRNYGLQVRFAECRICCEEFRYRWELQRHMEKCPGAEQGEERKTIFFSEKSWTTCMTVSLPQQTTPFHWSFSQTVFVFYWCWCLLLRYNQQSERYRKQSNRRVHVT